MITNIDNEKLLYAVNRNGKAIRAVNVNGSDIGNIAGTLTLMTYNCGGYYIGSGTNVPSDKVNLYKGVLHSIMEANSADIMCVQEHWTNFSTGITAESIIREYYDDWGENGGSTTYGGRATASRLPVLSRSYWTFSKVGSQGNCYDTVVNVGGKSVHVLSIHLDWVQQDRQALQVRELLTWAADKEYFVICGDFNSECTARSGEDWYSVLKPFEDVGYTLGNGGKFGFKITSAGYALDNIITSPNIVIEKVWRDETKLHTEGVEAVDHLPLCARMVVC